MYTHPYPIKVLRLKDVHCVGVPFPSVCFSNQQMLVLHRGHSANISSLFHTCSKQDPCYYCLHAHHFIGFICLSFLLLFYFSGGHVPTLL